MTESAGDPRPSVEDRRPGIRGRWWSRLPAIFLGLVVVGAAGSFIFDDRRVEAVANHLAGLGIVGLLACLAAYVARKKGRDPGTAFLLGSLLPIALGLVAVVIVYLTTRFVYCGGGVILLSSLLVIIGYSCMRKKRSVAA
jgi:lipopolysaccharide export LptBFGC system permease protein LptF